MGGPMGASPALPAARTPGAYRIAVVCLGNICRSPTADVVLAAHVSEARLDDRVEVVSGGTGDWHVGGPMDARAAALLTEHGYDPSRHRAQQAVAAWLDEFDLVLAMDSQNLSDLRDLGEAEPARLRLFGDFDPKEPGADVPDPYYGGDAGFQHVLAMIERTSTALVAALPAVVAT